MFNYNSRYQSPERVKQNLCSESPANKKRRRTNDDIVLASDLLDQEHVDNNIMLSRCQISTVKACPQPLILDLSINSESENNHTSSSDKTTNTASTSQAIHNAGSLESSSSILTTSSLTGHRVTNKAHNHQNNFHKLASNKLINIDKNYHHMTNQEKNSHKKNILARFVIVSQHIASIKEKIEQLKHGVAASRLILQDQATPPLDAKIELSIIVAKEVEQEQITAEQACLTEELIKLGRIKERLSIDDTTQPQYLNAARTGKAQPTIDRFFDYKTPASAQYQPKKKRLT